ncbi:MAG TPA: hypothetical protein VGC77_11120 [Rhodopseudomonas sp.]|uniref:hypothetical protein n=1 Tax=Rhodopseudomonas sp. TaxID=1078 RepID=UPI002EDAD90E
MSETRGERKNWHAEAWRLFGYYLMTNENQDAVARALSQIDGVLRDHGDVEITVQSLPFNAAIAAKPVQR